MRTGEGYSSNPIHHLSSQVMDYSHHVGYERRGNSPNQQIGDQYGSQNYNPPFGFQVPPSTYQPTGTGYYAPPPEYQPVEYCQPDRSYSHTTNTQPRQVQQYHASPEYYGHFQQPPPLQQYQSQVGQSVYYQQPMQHVQQEYVQYQTEAPPSYCYTQPMQPVQQQQQYRPHDQSISGYREDRRTPTPPDPRSNHAHPVYQRPPEMQFQMASYAETPYNNRVEEERVYDEVPHEDNYRSYDESEEYNNNNVTRRGQWHSNRRERSRDESVRRRPFTPIQTIREEEIDATPRYSRGGTREGSRERVSERREQYPTRRAESVQKEEIYATPRRSRSGRRDHIQSDRCRSQSDIYRAERHSSREARNSSLTPQDEKELLYRLALLDRSTRDRSVSRRDHSPPSSVISTMREEQTRERERNHQNDDNRRNEQSERDASVSPVRPSMRRVDRTMSDDEDCGSLIISSHSFSVNGEEERKKQYENRAHDQRQPSVRGGSEEKRQYEGKAEKPMQNVGPNSTNNRSSVKGGKETRQYEDQSKRFDFSSRGANVFRLDGNRLVRQGNGPSLEYIRSSKRTKEMWIRKEQRRIEEHNKLFAINNTPPIIYRDDWSPIDSKEDVAPHSSPPITEPFIPDPEPSKGCTKKKEQQPRPEPVQHEFKKEHRSEERPVNPEARRRPRMRNWLTRNERLEIQVFQQCKANGDISGSSTPTESMINFSDGEDYWYDTNGYPTRMMSKLMINFDSSYDQCGDTVHSYSPSHSESSFDYREERRFHRPSKGKSPSRRHCKIDNNSKPKVDRFSRPALDWRQYDFTPVEASGRTTPASSFTADYEEREEEMEEMEDKPLPTTLPRHTTQRQYDYTEETVVARPRSPDYWGIIDEYDRESDEWLRIQIMMQIKSHWMKDPIERNHQPPLTIERLSRILYSFDSYNVARGRRYDDVIGHLFGCYREITWLDFLRGMRDDGLVRMHETRRDRPMDYVIFAASDNFSHSWVRKAPFTD